MKIIFLDIDGVLNSEKFYKECRKNGILYNHESVDPEGLKRILYIIEKTDAKIILSSSWRLSDVQSTIDSFRNKPLEPLIPYIIGITPRLNKKRGYEIAQTVSQWKKEVESSRILEPYKDIHIDDWVILDDDKDMLLAQMYRLVQTDYQVGLTEEQAELAIEILNNWKGYLYKKKTEEFVEWMKNIPKFDTPRSIPEVPNVGKELVDKYIVPVMIEHGAIPKDQLKIGVTYIGSCRNASKAIWNGERFIYERYKWGSRFNESINHFQDDDGYDVFVPIKECND